MKLRMTPAVGLLFLLSACQTMSADQDQPARISAATDASRAVLQETVNNAMHTNVLLADGALTTSSVLTIELNPPGTMENPTPLGRDMGKPIQFRLVLNQEACILIDQRDDTRHILNDTTCVAE